MSSRKRKGKRKMKGKGEKLEINVNAQDSLIPYVDQIWLLSYTPWVSPKLTSEYCKLMMNSFTNNAIAATDLANKLVISNIEAVQNMSDTAKEYYIKAWNW